MKLLIEKRIKYNFQTHLWYIDFEKAYDRVMRGKLFDTLARRGILEDLMRKVRLMYDNEEFHCYKYVCKNN